MKISRPNWLQKYQIWAIWP